VTVRGANRVSASDVEEQLATVPSPKLFGLFRGVVYDYELFDLYALQRDLARVERFYHAKGYYDAHARAGRWMETSRGHVRVEIVVEEGEPVILEDIAIVGIEGLPEEVARAVRETARHELREGRPFDEELFRQGEKDLVRTLTDRGWAFAKVTSEAWVDVVHHVARGTYTVKPDRVATFGEIKLEGLPPEIPEDKIRGALDIESGDPYSTKSIDEAAQALLDLGVLASVDVEPVLADPPPEDRVVPIVVRVEGTRLRELRLGGGIEFDQIKTDIHGLVGWRNRNFLGGLRDFSVEARPGVVLYPTRISDIRAPDQLLPEERLSVQLRQPGFLEGRTTGFIRPELNTFPLLVKARPAEGDPVIGYVEAKGATGVDRSFGRLFVGVLYNAQVEFPFAYKDPFDSALRTLVISYPEIVTSLDLRDDRIHTKKGIFLGNDLQVAGGPFFGDARDVKIQPEIRGYTTIAKRFTFASRASVGFLFPFNYGDTVKHHLVVTKEDPITDENRADRTRDIQTVYFRGFFSGGANSNRGFPIRGVAPHGVVPFLNPSTASQQVQNECEPTAANNFTPDPTNCSIPIGGFTLWEFSNEIRIAVGKQFYTAVFCDMSDVSPETASIRLDHMHLSCGVGARYDTIVGPIRVDLGYRVQPFQVLGFRSEVEAREADPKEGVQPTIFGVPLAIAIGIGEAF
jgi:outer membrane protein assembly factor BamA